jgi:hypothetical protein
VGKIRAPLQQAQEDGREGGKKKKKNNVGEKRTGEKEKRSPKTARKTDFF